MHNTAPEEITGIVGGIQKFSVDDGPGIRTTVFLKGCPLNCAWCHNPELIDRKEQVMFRPNRCITCFECVKTCESGTLTQSENKLSIDHSSCKKCMVCTGVCFSGALSKTGKEMTVAEVMRLVLQDKAYYNRTGGGLTVSGGEVLMQAEFTEALIDAAKSEKINVAIDTCGFGDFGILKRLAGKSDYILYDIKLMDSEKHKKYTGVCSQPILAALERLAAEYQINSKIQIRLVLVQGVNDDDENIRQTLDFLTENKLRDIVLLPYHELGVSKKRNLGIKAEVFSPPTEERVSEIKVLFEAGGIETGIL